MASGAVSLTEGKIRPLIIRFSIPVFISHIFTELYNITNSLIVGNYVSLEALSAVSACSWICNIFNFAFFGMGMGAGIIVGRYYGAKDEKNLKKALDTSIIFAICGGIIITVVSELFRPTIMKMANIGADIYPLADDYLRIYFLGSTAVLTSQICFFTLRSFGDTKHQLYFSIISSIVNIVLGVLFVRVFNMSIIGTALATIISQFVMDGLALRTMLNYKVAKIDLLHPDFSFKLVEEICSLGLPAGFQNMLIAVSSMMVQSYVNTFPNEVIAGIGVAEKIAGWGQLISVSVSAATMALVAQNLGAGEYDRVKKSIKESALVSSTGTLISIALIVLGAPFLVSRFNSNPDVIYYGTQMIYYSIFGMFFINLSHIYNGACRGGSNVKAPMVIALFAQCFCKYMFVSVGMKLFNDVHVLYLGTAFGYTLAGILATLYFYRSKWTKKHGLR